MEIRVLFLWLKFLHLFSLRQILCQLLTSDFILHLSLLVRLLASSSPHYFKHVKISALAMLKMVRLSTYFYFFVFLNVQSARIIYSSNCLCSLLDVSSMQVMHARSGGNIEVMGLMQVS